MLHGSDLKDNISLLDRGYVIIMDNFYSSVNLFYALLNRKTYCVGTVCKGSKNLPKDVFTKVGKQVKMNNGCDRGGAVFRFSRCGRLKFACWKDNKVVLVLSTEPQHTNGMKLLRRKCPDALTASKTILLPAPEMIRKYIAYMRGVDVWGMLLGDSSYPLSVGVAVLQQLRTRLLTFGFNECILLFSDLPEIDIGRCVDDSTLLYARTPKSVTFRQHASPDDDTRFISTQATSMDMAGQTVSELKSQPCSRLSGAEFDHLTAAGGADDGGIGQLLAVDVRPADEYNRGSLSDSINLPYSADHATSGAPLLAGSAGERLRKKKGKAVIVVVDDSRMSRAWMFAAELIKLGFSRVCVLDKGVDAYKQTSALTVRTNL